MMQTHILRSFSRKDIVFCGFLQDFTHLLLYVSKIILKTTMSGISLRYFWENNKSNPYIQPFKTKKSGFWRFFPGFDPHFTLY